MSRPLRRLPLVEQTVMHLREGIRSRRWVDTLPGVLRLEEELMVSKQIVRTALKALEDEGWIEDCGAGRRRKIVADRRPQAANRSLRIGIMLYEPLEGDEGHTVKILWGIRQGIEAAGHVCIIAGRSLTQLNDNLASLSRVVKAVNADAWIVWSASQAVLEWFTAQPVPVYALGGRYQDLPVAASSSYMAPAIESAVNELMAQGHRRIALLAPSVLRKPKPAPSFETYLALLESHGITGADYHLPHFEETTAGLAACLDSLFKITPPTALLVLHSTYCIALMFFLARRGLQTPRDVSLICVHAEPVFRMSQPTLAQFNMPVKQHVANITRWINGVANGKPHTRQTYFDAVYVPGGTVGPVKK